MKHFLRILISTFVLSLALQAIGQSGPTFEEVRNSRRGHIFLFADNVNIRSKPSLDSEVLATLDEGTPLVHIMHLSERDTIGGRVGQWVHVLYQGQSAFVWEPLITYRALRSHQDPDVLFLIGQGPTSTETMVKVFEKGEKTQELVFTGLKHQGPEAMEKWEIRGNQGVELVDEFLYFHYYAYACGKIGGNVIFAWDGKTLRHFFTEWSIGDGGFFEGENLVFPSDPVGEKGVIHLFEEAGEQIFAESDEAYAIPEIRYDRQIHKQYLWDGTKLVEMRRE